jgi:hypothetical protein
MQRRDFLKNSTATMLALGAAPTVLTARDKSGARPAIVGAGEHRYECHHNWGTLPAGFRWETTHGVCVDGAGLVYIKHQGHGGPARDTILVFDPTGKFVRSFGRDYYPGGHGIDLRKDGSEEFLYLSDIHRREVIKTNLRGEEVWKLCYPLESGKYQRVGQYRPTNVAFAPDGGLYVGDGYGSHYIHQYDRNQKWVRTWGGFGDAPGKMKTPHGIWLDNRPGRTPSLVVADRANARLQYFSLDGRHLGFVREVSFPAHFDIRGEVLMVPDLHGRVSLFDKENKVIAHLGDDRARVVADKGFTIRRDPKKWQAGKFVHPHDACFDRDGNILVVEWVQTGRVTFLKKLA